MTEAKAAFSRAGRIDAACDQFESACRAGNSPQIELYVARADEADRDSLRSALVAIEAELRERSAADTSVSQSSVVSPAPVPEGATVLIQSPGEASPATIGRFTIRNVLGSGAFGKVYRAVDPQLGREVAIKVPLAAATLSASEKERFLKEARSAATINHPNVCQIFEVGEHAGQPYIVMAIVPGQSLADVLKSRKQLLPAKQIAQVVRKIALALAAAHDRGVVHRDLKPANVMFDRERKDIVVMDFGLARGPRLGDARGTQTGVVMGTPAYMSPEQARGDSKDVGPAGDIYSLGVILYELLTGTRPFSGTTTEVIGQILHVEPQPPSRRREGVDPALEAACLKALAKDPSQRFASMKEFAKSLDAAARPMPLPAAPAIDTARATNTKDDTDASSTSGPQLTEVFAVLSADRKVQQAATAAALEAAVSRSRTPRWVWVALVLTMLGGFSALGGIVFFTRSGNAHVKLALYMEGVNLADKELSFFLDDEPISAEALTNEIELKPGEHVLTVKRGKEIVKRILLTVTGGRKPDITPKDITPPPLMDDLKQLQGMWDVVAEEIHGQPIQEERIRQMAKNISFVDSRMTMHRANEKGLRIFREGTINLNPSASPKSWDFTGIDYTGKPIVFRGLYELNGDSLRLVYNSSLVDEGNPVRPTEFRTAPGTQTLITTAKRRTQLSDEQGFVPLFNGKDLTGWTVESGDAKNWMVKDGTIVTSAPLSTEFKDTSWLLSEKPYTDFIARFEFMVEKGVVNSGFAIRALPGERTSANSIRPAHMQIAILPAEAGARGQITGTAHTGDVIVNLDPQIDLSSNSIGQKPAGQWNLMEVELRGQLIHVRLNGETTLRANLDNAIKKGGTIPGLTRTSGRIGFRRLWGTTRYRNIQIKELAPPAEQGFVPLFNGKDLMDWKGLPGAWKLAGDDLIGHLPEDYKGRNSFLGAKKPYKNFELKFQVKLHAGTGNSGVQIRSRVHDEAEFVVHGPQVEIDAIRGAGGLYGEGDGGWMKQAPLAVVRNVYKPGEFNDYHVAVVGKHVKIVVNGSTLVDDDFPAMADEGVLAFQLHTGMRDDVTFRNVRIKELTPPAEEGFVPLFNGKDLTGWKAHPDDAAKWTVEDGCLTATGPVGHLFTERSDYENFVFRIEAKINEGGNSGQHFRTQFAERFPPGYEAQINVSHRDPIKTGSLYPSFDRSLTTAQKERLVVTEASHRAGEWFTQEVTAVGNHITIKVNGRTTVDFVDESKTFSKGYLAIQHHDPACKVLFRKVEVKELAPAR